MKREANWILTIIKDKWFLLYLGISFLYCTLFIFNTYPPFQDYPNHLLEAKVIANPEKFAPYYKLDLKPVPNITNQISLALLSMIMDVNLAGRIYNMLYIILFGIGAYLFSRIFLNKNFLAGLAFFLFCCNFFFWRGYMNFFMGTALCLVFLPLSTNIAIKRSASNLLMDILFVLILYFTHALAAGVFILYKLVYIIKNDTRKMFRIILFLVPVIVLSIVYMYLSSGQYGFTWHYGTGAWKIVSLKRMVAIPYISTLETLWVFNLLNCYNALMYLLFIGTIIISPFILRKSGVYKSDIFWLFLLLLAITYVLVPTNLGVIETDTRISFFLILFFVVSTVHLVIIHNRHYEKLIRVIIIVLIAGNFILSFLQFRLPQSYLSDFVSSLPTLSQSQSNQDLLYVPRRENVFSLAENNILFSTLEKIKLHTDLTQVTFIDEHIDSYFYFDGGYPRKLFVYSIIKRGAIQEPVK